MIHWQLGGGLLRTFNIVNDYRREALEIDDDLSLPSERALRSLDQIIEWRGKPAAIRCDNSPEYTAHEFLNWANKKSISR